MEVSRFWLDEHKLLQLSLHELASLKSAGRAGKDQRDLSTGRHTLSIFSKGGTVSICFAIRRSRSSPALNVPPRTPRAGSSLGPRLARNLTQYYRRGARPPRSNLLFIAARVPGVSPARARAHSEPCACGPGSATLALTQRSAGQAYQGVGTSGGGWKKSWIFWASFG